MPRVFNLKLEKKFKGGQKEWQTFNHLVLTLLINENLTLFSDVVLCLHEHIQASLETTESEEEIEYRNSFFLDSKAPTKERSQSIWDASSNEKLPELLGDDDKDGPCVRLRRAFQICAGAGRSAPDDARDLDKLHGWVDSDFAADPDTRRSMTGYLISMNNGPISFEICCEILDTHSKDQPV
eukprot:CAMPEP_0181315108 /NCGR_PEP_ID=MMETSP1101-20121128/15189_1 /TAXON_ID=46948 /ORGANISM="Rhodomonas abbreviata, Strain Caron Lab Isolate" /LENGTH=181 /DNA_ID=CAMNT_0023422273 /DNA_START=118 /DNA_END=663 /DNA_ORIENTATION=-